MKMFLFTRFKNNCLFSFICLMCLIVAVDISAAESETQDLDQTVEPRIEIGTGTTNTVDEDLAESEEPAGIPTLPNESDIVVDRREEENDNEMKQGSLPKYDETLITPPKNFYSFTVLDIEGNSVNLEQYRGMISLVVNVASECGFTDSHYSSLVQLYDLLAPTGKFTILAFPCNQFGAQEPGNNDEIATFTTEQYQVNFPMFSKIRVIDSDVSEAWKFLEEQSGKVPNWNFWKYLVDEDGNVVDAWGPWTSVDDIYSQVKSAVDRLTKPKDPVLPDIITQDRQEL